MRVAVSYTTTVDDDYRRAICRFYGEDRLATREEVKRWLENYGSSMDDDLARFGEEEEVEVAFLRELSTRANLTEAERKSFDVLRRREINESIRRRNPRS